MSVASIPTFGERLKAIREAAGLTQAQLAERSGVSAAFLSRIESGERKDPAWSIVVKLARALDVDMNAFDVEPPADQPEPPESPPAPPARPMGKRK